MRYLLVTFVLLLLAAGCVTQSAAPGDAARASTAPPLPQETPRPTVTFADPVQAARDAHNVAYFLDQTATAVQQNAVATQAVIVAATQQVEQFNAMGTQQAVSVRATATAAELGLQQQQAQISMAATATMSAQRMADTLATAEAVRVAEAQLAAEERAARVRLETAARQRDLTLTDALAIIIVVAAGALAYSLVTWIDRRLRNDTVRPVAGTSLLLADGRLYRMPEVVEGEYNEAPIAGRLESVVQRAVDRGRAVGEDLAQQRARRVAWRNAAWAFLRWGAYLDGFSQPRMMEAGISDTAWRAMVEFLAGLGLLVKDGVHRTAPWALALDGDGERMTVRGALQARVWLTSFETPDATPPSIPRPPAASYAYPNPNEPNERTRRPEPPEPPEADDLPAPGAIPAQWTYASRLATAFPPELHIEPAPGE